MNVNIKKIITKINIKTFLVTFSYETRKGYYREQQRLIGVLDKEDPKKQFETWVSNCRTIFNAKILSIVEMKDLNRVIEI
ncbi:MAG: hypothetical protein E6342_00525 [Clostridium sp.]|jgi:hypothetical protein|uniref:hypothetical protein n=1 Tax=Clostridium sp. TaxID=1506 RepID=UPI00115C41FC|nr:hypothetical protein [Clostridium sp.]MDU1279183.1 hypothetical protein [Clostridium sp.]MDU7086177.1 hypothetical protein [Clostridium sp.]